MNNACAQRWRFDPLPRLCTWMAFGGNTRDLGSFGEETDEITDLHQILEKILLTELGDGVTSIKRRHRDPSSDGARDLVTASGRIHESRIVDPFTVASGLMIVRVRIMNQEVTRQFVARNEKWVPTKEIVKISTTNAFIISAEVPKIFMQQFGYTVKKVKDTESYEFLLANKKCVVDVEVFWKILDICPRVQGEDFAELPDDEATLTFFLDLGYKGPLHKHPSMVLSDVHEILHWSNSSQDEQMQRRVVKKKVIITIDDNIVPELDVALELGKSISLIEAVEEEVARKVHATHARIVTEPIPEPGRRRPSCIAFKDTSSMSKKMSLDSSQNLKGVQTLTPEEQIASDTMKALKETTVVPATLSEGTGTKPGVPNEEKVTFEDKVILEWGSEQESEYSEEEDDDETIEYVDMDKQEEKKDDDDDKSIELEQTDDEETNDEFVYSKEHVQDDDEETDDEFVHGTVMKKFLMRPSSTYPSILTVPVLVNSEPSILTSIPKTPLVAPATTLLPHRSVFTIPPLRVAKLEKDVSELKKIDHSPKALVTLKSQVPTVVEHYLGSKIGDDLQKTSTIDLEQESEKSTSEILKTKKEQAEKQKMLKYTIKSTDKAALKEYDLKSALYQIMNENKSFNRNLVNHTLYHVLMEALIEDENAMDKGVADTVKNHKRRYDDEDDDEDPSVGPNQGKKIKRRRTKESESSMKPSTTKETSKGKAPSKSSKTGKSTTTQEPIEEPIAKVVMDDLETTANEDVVNDADHPQDNVAPNIDEPFRDTWFKQPLRPPTPDPEWNKCQVVTDQPKQPWFNKMVSAAKDPLTFNELMATPIDFSNSIELEYNIEECFKAMTNRLNWNNTLGDRCPFDLAKPLPLKGRPRHLTVSAEYFFNNDLEFLKSSDPENKYTTSITKTKATRYEIVGIEDMAPTLWNTIKVGYDKDVEKGIKHRGERRKLCVSVKKLHGYGHLEEIRVRRADRHVYKFKEGDFTLPEIEFKELYTPSYKPPGVIYEDLNKQKRVMRADELYKFSDRTLKTVRDELHHSILDFRLGYNEEMSRRKWKAVDKRRSELMVELIDKQMRKRRIIRNLERLVGAQEL
ncbi:hypothetical protein Tco_0703984 [Tanacetum coccineum]|uniref:Uncharacterized protein n=1 Tax=Tanacetum coccineum TaxID=301880 RepID=A0ABQ4Y0E0_9ASTR